MVSVTSSKFASQVIDVEGLLAPIPGANPAGENLKYAGLHGDIREARRADDMTGIGEWAREPKLADWHQVISLATSALATQTKDLQVCAWLTEALVRLHSFAGLRDGLSLTRRMVEQFWDHVYPEIDEGDLEARSSSLEWMDNYRNIPLAIKEVSITDSITGENYSYLQWEDSREYDIPENLEDLDSEERRQMVKKQQLAAEEGKITTEQWRVAKNMTPPAFYQEIYALLNESWEEFQALDRLLDEKFGQQAPTLSAVKKSIDDVRSLIGQLLSEKPAPEPDTKITEENAAVATEPPGAQPTVQPSAGGTSGAIQERQEAFRRLAEVADFFRRTEPHSPVSYLVQRAIRWGQMPLDLWLEDVIKNGGVLDELRETLGLRAPSDGSGG